MNFTVFLFCLISKSFISNFNFFPEYLKFILAFIFLEIRFQQFLVVVKNNPSFSVLYTLTRTFPIGTDVEVFSFSALNRAWENTQLPSEREHVTPYLRKEENFKIINIENDKNISNLRLTVDRIEDFELIKQILNNISINPIHLEDVLELFSRKPELIEINKHINHNEGFNKSLEEDKEFIKKQKR